MIDGLTFSEALKIVEVFVAKGWEVTIKPYKVKQSKRYRVEWREIEL
jgi:hypothetical protein